MPLRLDGYYAAFPAIQASYGYVDLLEVCMAHFHSSLLIKFIILYFFDRPLEF